MTRTYLVACLLLALAACAPATPSAGQIQTAIAQTMTAQPTPTAAPVTPTPPAKPTSTPPPNVGKWQISEDVNSLDGSKTVILSLDADKEIAGMFRPVKPQLYIRCTAGSAEVYIWPKVSLDFTEKLTTVQIRLDSEDIRTEVLSHSSDNQALFFGNGAIWAARLRQYKTMAFGFTPYQAAPITTIFDLTDIDQAMKPFDVACPK